MAQTKSSGGKAVTQKAMGKGQIVERLTAQVGSKGMAIGLLKKNGLMTAGGKLTTKGEKRNAMTAEQRAKSRASKTSGKPASSYKYNPKTNRATRKKK